MTHADPPRPPPSTTPAAPAVPTAPAASPDAGAAPAPVDWSEESTAGEEDPGASLDLALDPPTPSGADAPTPSSPPAAR
jgi:hypothetical protein